MWASYEDITKRIAEAPLWWDECGVPRYDPFTPHLLQDIYAQRAALLRISCQYCEQEFDVAVSGSFLDGCNEEPWNPKGQHYGDPPIHGCVGDTMNVDDLAVIEAWTREHLEWVRHPELEGPSNEMPASTRRS